MGNAYQTNDPQKLLELKRLEADALLDVVRTINQSELNIRQLCLIARNVLRAQIGIRRLAFFFESEDMWKEGIRVGFPVFTEDVFAEIIEIRQTTPVDAARHPGLQAIGAEFVIPITNRGLVAAFFVLAEFADSEIERQNDLIFIETLGHILVVAIFNRQLIREKVEQEFLKKELEVAETIQKQLLISDFSRFKELDIYGINLAHHRIGGDFFDVIKKESGSTFLCIADVSGKGIGAALLMSNLQANLRSLCAQYHELPVIIRELNSLLFHITTGEKFVTLFLARVDHAQRTLAYVNAGHNYPLMLSQGEAIRLSTGCMLLGIVPNLPVQEATLSYNPGDVLFMFTDGVVEQTNREDEMYGSERLASELFQSSDCSSREIVERVRRSLELFADQSHPSDDITMLSVKFYP
ncbi:MAG: PP2C family protein-serine/threonine phosphatase [Bacteroidia bacterium]|nr:PP2C family protein-serine/threonine phosphatase [Bacteroidia bacterium]